MADNELDLIQWQLGKQSAFASITAPTAKLMGIQDGEILAMPEASHVEEQRASLAPAFAAQVDKVTGEASLSGELTFEQGPYWLDSLLGTATPAGGGPYTRDWAAPLGSKPTPSIFTLLRGSALDARSLVGAIMNELNITVETNQRAKFEGKAIGHYVVSDSVESLSDISPGYVHANQVAIALDTWAGTMGGTALTPTAYKLELALNMNKMLQMGLGALNPVSHKHKKGEPGSNQLKLSMELDSTSAGYYNSIITATNEPFRAQIEAEFTLGTDIFRIQYAGYCPEAPGYLSDEDGVATLEFTFNPLYHSTFGNWLKLHFTNSVATLP